MIKVCQAIIATVITDPGNGFFSLDKHPGSKSYPYILNIIHKSIIGFLFKIPAERSGSHIYQIGSCLKFYAILNMFMACLYLEPMVRLPL